MRRGLVVALSGVLGCSIDRPEGEGAAGREAAAAPGGAAVEEVGGGRERSGGAATDDPRMACMREHAVDSEHAGFEGVVRALCAELHDLRGVSASVAIAREDRVVFGVAVGPRCRGGEGALRVDAVLRIGSITKLVTTALALVVAERSGTGLDEPLTAVLPELVPAPTLRELMTHASGLRDPDPGELLVRGDAWPEALQEHREAAGKHAYANANFLVIGRWLERSAGRSYVESVENEPLLAAVRGLVRFELGGANGSSDGACGHRLGSGSGSGSGSVWEPVVIADEPPLPTWTIPAGGGFASAEALARLPFALERAGVRQSMLTARIPSDQPGWDYGLGVRMRGEGDDLVLAHSGNTGTHWAELQWSPKHRVAVAVMSTTPQAFKATLHAAFAAAVAEANAMP
jgi:CubicO group peptidase (beta-lactamase class C family)